MTFEDLNNISEQLQKKENAGLHEIKVFPNDVIAQDGVGILFLSTRDYDKFKQKNCKHEGDEIIKQGDGFVYKKCADCGADI